MSEYERKQLLTARIRTASMRALTLALTLAIALFVIIAVIAVVPRAYTALFELEEAAKGLQEVAAEIDGANLPGMAEEMDKVLGEIQSLTEDGHAAVNTAAETAEAALRKIETLDVETLNRAIEDFSAVVKPLARLFGK